MESILYAFSPARTSCELRPLEDQRRLLTLPTLPTAHRRLIAAYQAARRPLTVDLPRAA